MDELEIIVASRDEAARILSSDRCAEFSFMVSIGDPEERLPYGYHNIEDKLRLNFYDTIDTFGPTVNDVREIIAFAQRITARPARVLAHCQAGISRSTAAAYIIYAVALGRGREREALERVMRQRPFASPNRLMIALADELLERDGALIDAVEESL